MTSTRDAEETAREFATRFADGAFADAADLLTGDGREAVVASFPDEFPEGEMDAEDALESYWYGLYGQYGDAEAVGETWWTATTRPSNWRSRTAPNRRASGWQTTVTPLPGSRSVLRTSHRRTPTRRRSASAT